MIVHSVVAWVEAVSKCTFIVSFVFGEGSTVRLMFYRVCRGLG